MMRDQMKELTVFFPVPADPITLFKKKESKTKTSHSVALDLQNDYISFGYYRDINFVQGDFQDFLPVSSRFAPSYSVVSSGRIRSRMNTFLEKN